METFLGWIIIIIIIGAISQAMSESKQKRDEKEKQATLREIRDLLREQKKGK